MEKICTSFSNYHPESWAPTWNIEKMLMALLSFMNSDEMGAGGMTSSVSKKK
jgi:ubiquitin-conjugating enzyme E2 J2